MMPAAAGVLDVNPESCDDIRGVRKRLERDGIGYRIAYLRSQAGLTQACVADSIGVSREYISMLENGRREVRDRALLMAIAAALGVDSAVLARDHEVHNMAVLRAGDVRAFVEEGQKELVLIITDGTARVMVTGALGALSNADRGGAVRLSQAALAFARERLAVGRDRRTVPTSIRKTQTRKTQTRKTVPALRKAPTASSKT